MKPDVLAEMLADGRSGARRRDFAAGRPSARVVEDLDALTAALRWNQHTRSLFGDRQPSLRPWLGNDFRL